MQKQSKPKRNHHVLPELYLKGFVVKTSEPFIWVYKRGGTYNPGRGKITNNPYTDSIRRLTTRDYYAFPAEDGKKDFESYENFLEKLEKPADLIFQKLRSRQSISSDEKKTFCLYLVQMLKRVPAHRKGLLETAKKVVANYELPKQALAKFNLPDNEETRRKVRDIASGISQQKGFDTRIHLKVLSMVRSSLLLDALAKMSWRFFVAPPNNPFLAGDNPFFFTKRIGLNNPDSEVSFPISNEICLVASFQVFRDQFLEVPIQFIKELNRRTASNASTFLYSSQKEEWIVRLLNKQDHVLHRIL